MIKTLKTMNTENPKESVDIDRSKEIKKKLFQETNKVLKKADFKRHRTKRSAWWRQKVDKKSVQFPGIGPLWINYMVNLTTHKAKSIDDIDTYDFEMGDRMDRFFDNDENHKGRVHINSLLDFSDSDKSEDRQIKEFTQILEGFIPLYFDTPKRTKENRKNIRDLLQI